jgi:DNA-binding MarR family transcriptional regulator
MTIGGRARPAQAGTRSATPSRGPSHDRATALTALRGLIGALTHSARAIEAHTGITNAQLFLLRQFTTAAPLSVNELAARVHARQNTVSSVLARLTAAGLVEKVRAPDDRRRVALSLTRAGRRMLARAPAAPTEGLITALGTMPPRDVHHLAVGLQALVARLQLDVEDAPLLFEAPSRRK